MGTKARSKQRKCLNCLWVPEQKWKLWTLLSHVHSLLSHALLAKRPRFREQLLHTNHRPCGEETLVLISPLIGPLQRRDALPPTPQGSQLTSRSDYVLQMLPSYQIGRTHFPIMLSVVIPPSLHPPILSASQAALCRKTTLIPPNPFKLPSPFTWKPDQTVNLDSGRNETLVVSIFS